jgi:hypothetical protein
LVNTSSASLSGVIPTVENILAQKGTNKKKGGDVKMFSNLHLLFENTANTYVACP